MNLLEPNNTSNNKLYTNIEKHIKDNSFKINNTSMNKEDLKIRKKILNRIKNSSPILQLKIINSNSNFEKGTKLIINCQGLKNGINNRKDGYTYFGYYPYNMSIPLDDDGNKMIDCNLSSKKNNNVNLNDETINNLGRHFVIEYNIEKSKYIIKDLGIGYGTFVRLNYIHTLKDNQLINIGQIFILVYISEKGENFFTNTIGDSKGNMISGVVVGITIVALHPYCFAAYATPWAWFPADAVISPFALSSSVRVLILKYAPRTL